MPHEVITESPYVALEDYAPADKARAYELYLNSKMDITEIANTVQIPRIKLILWAKKEGWAAKRREVEQEYLQHAEATYRNFMVENRLPTLQRHLATSKLLEEEILRILEDSKKSGDRLDTMTLKRLAESLAAVSAVSARATGVAEKVVERSGDDSETRRRPLVAIGISPTLAGPDAKGGGTTINITGNADQQEQSG